MSEIQGYEELLQFIEEEDIAFIRLAYFDVLGRQKNIALMSGELERAVRWGVSIDGSAIAGFDANVRSDLFLKPDLPTLSIVPWRPSDSRVCRIFCDVVYPDGTPFESDTRFMLKEAVREAALKGIEVKFGSEMEFYIFRTDEQGRATKQPIDRAGYMDVEPLDAGENLRRDICFALLEMGITPESSHHERGPGQMEIDFRYSDPVRAADNTSTVKWAVRSICAADGYAADFSPKPLADEPGSGMHLNISVHSGEGRDDTDAFMAGILKYIRDITLFLNRTEKSYARFGRMEAPRYLSWAVQNRSQLIRIPADPSGRRRIELRSPDPKANPYLAFALLIRAGLYGVEHHLPLPAPMDINLYRAEPQLTRGLDQLPGSLQEAWQYAQHSDFVQKYVPASCLAAYAEALS
ncbi:MAG: glutamine synthetase family protein [Eubacteriales bacterium]|nr:glutamine synthetase family protein [Eubacteriales bacterium]